MKETISFTVALMKQIDKDFPRLIGAALNEYISKKLVEHFGEENIRELERQLKDGEDKEVTH